MYKIELLVSNSVVVGGFKVALNTSLSALAYWVKEAVREHSAHVIAWQVRCPDNRILCRVKVQAAT